MENKTHVQHTYCSSGNTNFKLKKYERQIIFSKFYDKPDIVLIAGNVKISSAISKDIMNYSYWELKITVITSSTTCKQIKFYC